MLSRRRVAAGNERILPSVVGISGDGAPKERKHAMPSHDDLSPTSLTRLLARSLLAEALETTLMPSAPHPATAPGDLCTPGRRHAYWTKARILHVLRGFVARTGAFPTYGDWRHAHAMGLPSRPTVIRQWGSLQAVRDLFDAETIL